jgi:hypothetical protein
MSAFLTEAKFKAKQALKKTLALPVSDVLRFLWQETEEPFFM